MYGQWYILLGLLLFIFGFPSTFEVSDNLSCVQWFRQPLTNHSPQTSHFPVWRIFVKRRVKDNINLSKHVYCWVQDSSYKDWGCVSLLWTKQTNQTKQTQKTRLKRNTLFGYWFNCFWGHLPDHFLWLVLITSLIRTMANKPFSLFGLFALLFRSPHLVIAAIWLLP